MTNEKGRRLTRRPSSYSLLDDRDFTEDEREFLVAMDRYKRRHRRPYPTWREVLVVLHGLGYRKGGGE
jgi:hypothetical protein